MILCLGGLALVISACGDAVCANVLRNDMPSPDGRRHVVVFSRACGATTAYSTQVSVLSATQAASGAGNAFIADDNRGAAPAATGEGPSVIARWLDAQTLELRYDSRDRILQRVSRVNDITIHYVDVAEPVSTP